MAMKLNYNEKVRGRKQFRGARWTTLPTVLSIELTKIKPKDYRHCKQLKLGNREDLNIMQHLPADRKYWRCLVLRAVGAGRVVIYRQLSGSPLSQLSHACSVWVPHKMIL